jgi:hypothetical protein
MLSFITIVLLIVAIGLQVKINRKFQNQISSVSTTPGPMGLMGPQGQPGSQGPQGPQGEMGSTNPMTEIEIKSRIENDAIIVERMLMVHPELHGDEQLMRIIEQRNQ